MSDTLTPEILHTLAVGIDRLNDGDLADRMTADATVRRMVQVHGLVFERGGFIPTEQATCGYVRGSDGPEYVFIMGNGSWSRPVADQVLYLDAAGLIPLRVL